MAYAPTAMNISSSEGITVELEFMKTVFNSKA
jgi:hypothetical protein